MTGEELVAFLEDSWGVHQQRAGQTTWAWDTHDLQGHLKQLEQLEMIDRDPTGRLTLLPLGQLAGEAGVAVETIVRLARAARASGPIRDPASLLALVQLTVELDEIFLPVNKRGWRTEAASWHGELNRHRTSPAVLAALRHTNDGLLAALARQASARMPPMGERHPTSGHGAPAL